MSILRTNRPTVFKALDKDSTALHSNQQVQIPAGLSFQVKSIQQKGSHYFVQLQQPIPPVGQSGYFYAPHILIEDRPPVAASERRGVWIPVTDCNFLASRTNIREAIQRLASLNFNTIYPVVWTRGYTFFPSQTAKQVIGSEIYPQPAYQNRDVLAEVIEEAKAVGIRVVPWLEYGLMTPSGSPLATRHPNWLTKTANGTLLVDGQCWLNPLQPDVIQFMKNLVMELVTTYDIDGIQLDDHFCMPSELGYDDFTKSKYRLFSGGLEPPTHPDEVKWKEWRAKNLTDLMHQIFNVIKGVKPTCLVSLSPNPQSYSYNRYLLNWRHWANMGIIEEVIVQVYKSDLGGFKKELTQPEIVTLRDHIPVSIGITTGTKANPVPFAQIKQQVDEVRKSKLAGVSLFYYETVVNQALSPQAVARVPMELGNLFA